jgi:hypothetical protein
MPFNNRRIPIITDAITVDMEFGTGAVKITPAHDPIAPLMTHLEFASVLVVCSVVVHQANELEVVSLTTLEMLRSPLLTTPTISSVVKETTSSSLA